MDTNTDSATPAEVQTPTNTPAQIEQGTNWYAVIGFILSLCSSVLIGGLLSLVGYRKSKTMNGSGKGLAVAGMVLAGVWSFLVVVFVIIAVIVNLNSNNTSSELKTYSSTPASYALSASSSFVELDSGNPSADLQYYRPFDEIYFITITESVSDFEDGLDIEAYADVVREGLTNELKNPEVSEQSFGNPRLLDVVDYRITGSVDGVKIVYLYRVARVGDNFVQVIAWTLPSKEEENSPEMKTIIESLKPNSEQEI
jgi:hypothetical protein